MLDERVSTTGALPVTTKLRLSAEVLWTYVRVRRAMFRVDLPTAIARIRLESSASRSRREPVTVAEARHLSRAVRGVLSVLPADSRCLMQSLVLIALLARHGAAATLVIGVDPGDESASASFGAHAWAELDHQPLLPTFAGQFARLVEL